MATHPSNSTTAALVVISVNGNHGSTHDFDNFALSLPQQAANETLPPVFHLQSTTSQGWQTHDGIVMMATRAAKEAVTWMRENVLPNMPKGDGDVRCKLYLSVVGHSLGGLIARYLIKLLLEDASPTNSHTSLLHLLPSDDTNITLHPLTFMTVCTPHLGSRRTTLNHWTAPFFRSIVANYLKFAAGTTGKELYMVDGDRLPNTSNDDEWSDDPAVPLLLRISHPRSTYVAALKRFQIVLISAIQNDIPVGYLSAAITAIHPYPDLLAHPENAGGVKIVGVSGFTATIPAQKCTLLSESDASSDTLRAFWMKELFTHTYLDDTPILTPQTVELAPSVYTSFPTDQTETETDFPSLTPIDARKTTLLLYTLHASLPPLTIRRMDLDFRLSNPLARLATHALAVGKAEGGWLNVEGGRVARVVGELLARIVLLDYVRMRREGGVRCNEVG
ncbi:putative serine esterase-domain-containing protein [Fimicolochytrium jonesii]|uniref:putative serine esterase-domain-containing protein n=1 Tax=Fimicolochytrium jonesii TaxID=1396493 RepID=UPI0022FE7BB6|nr:putative serine esterase-domain-containing protein [Fimicolochytrium jonesii]KAI8817265.1 putative serine esterase-domain-containing protein [Fimicolochytrium jonesii]